MEDSSSCRDSSTRPRGTLRTSLPRVSPASQDDRVETCLLFRSRSAEPTRTFLQDNDASLIRSTDLSTIDTVFELIQNQTESTLSPSGHLRNSYAFHLSQPKIPIPNQGLGHPAKETGLVKTSFRRESSFSSLQTSRRVLIPSFPPL